MELIPESKINREIEHTVQTPIPYNSNKDFPYDELGSRRFELMIFLLFKRLYEEGIYREEFDEIGLVNSYRKRGRDIILRKEGQNVGLIHCRRKQNNISSPAIARDVIRFVLYSLIGKELAFEKSRFVFYYATGGGINEKALSFVNDFNENIVSHPRLKFWVTEVLETSLMLETLSYEDVQAELKSILSLIDLELIQPRDLDRYLNQYPDIKSMFFGMEMLTTEQLLKKLVDRFNVKDLSDHDASELVNKLKNIPEENRLGVGLMSFFGYDKDFLKSISQSDRLKQILIKGAEFKAEIDFALLDYIRYQTELFSGVLLNERKDVLEITKLAVVPFVFSKFAIKYLKSINSKVLTEIVRSSKEIEFYEKADIQEIKANLLKRCEAMTKPQEEKVSNQAQDPVVHIDRMMIACAEAEKEEDISRRFDEDWESLQPTIRAIYRKMIRIIPKNPTIVIEDMGTLDDRSRFEKLLSEIRNQLPRIRNNRSR